MNPPTKKDINGFTEKEQKELMETWKDAKQGKNMKTFHSAEELIKDLNK